MTHGRQWGYRRGGQGVLLSQAGEKLDSMSLLMYMAPIAAVQLLPATILMEGNVVAKVRASAATYPCTPPYFFEARHLKRGFEPELEGGGLKWVLKGEFGWEFGVVSTL